MAEPFFPRNFEEFLGLDFYSSPLTGSLLRASKFQNMRRSEGPSIRGRPGCQMVGGPTGFTAIKTYVYADPSTGESVEELIGINHRLWKLTISINASFDTTSGNPPTFDMTFNSSSGTFRFIAYQDGVPFTFGGNQYIDLGTGLEDSPVTMLDLISTLDGHASLTASFSGSVFYARVDGTQSSSTIQVDAGHTGVAGQFMSLYDRDGGNLGLRLITQVLVGPDRLVFDHSVSVLDNQVLGIPGVPAVSIPLGSYTNNSLSGIVIPFYYWEATQNAQNLGGKDEYSPLEFLRQAPIYPISWVNKINNGYFAAQISDLAKLMKYDGQSVYYAGLPKPTISSVVDAGAGAIADGTYRWKALFKQVDNRGNIIEGTPADPVSAVMGGGSSSATVTIDTSNITDDYNKRGGYFNNAGTETGNTLQVDQTTGGRHSIRIGDTVYFRDNAGAFHQRTVTGVNLGTAPYQITIDGAAVTVANNTPISINLRISLYRTKAGGNVYFLVSDYVFDIFLASQALTDNIADSGLGAQLIEPPIGKEHDPPPACSAICLHQDSIVAARSFAAPNTVAFSSSDGPEYFPLASNYFDVPSNIEGWVTAIASDTEDRLAIFKANGYYEAVGALDENNFTSRIVREGDYGVSSADCLNKVNGFLVGIGRLGPIAVQGGQLIKDIGKRIAPYFWNNDLIDLDSVMAINDYTSRQYIAFIPSRTWALTNNFYTLTNTGIYFALDYENNLAWYDGLYGTAVSPNGGYAVFKERLYHLHKDWSANTAFKGYVFRELSTIPEPGGFGTGIPGASQADIYQDNHLAIDYDWITEWEPLEEPSIDKEWIRAKAYVIPGPYESALGFTTQVTVYSNFSQSNVHSQFNLTFNGTTDFEQSSKLSSKKSRALQFRFRTNTLKSSPFFTGMELVARISRLKEDMLK